MNELTKKLISGAVSGFLAAFLVDLQIWSKSDAPFDWKKASKRWIAGAVSGATAALGMSSL